MSASERALVGQALEDIRDALAPYVDEAMTRVFGQEWNDRVADDDAKRLKRKKWPVSKTDLAVMLKAIIHQRIQPWQALTGYPQIRAYASEVLAVRNQHRHDEACEGEYSRLIDTANRLLTVLGRPIPTALEPVKRDLTAFPVGAEMMLAEQPPMLPPESFDTALDAAFAGFGEDSERVLQIILRAIELSRVPIQEFEPILLTLDAGNPDFSTFDAKLKEVMNSVGSEVLELLGEWDHLESTWSATPDPNRAVAAQWVWCLLLDGMLEVCAKSRVSHLQIQHTRLLNAELDRIEHGSESEATRSFEFVPNPALDAVEARIDEARRLVSHGESKENRLQELLRLCSDLDDASLLANYLGTYADVNLASASKDEEGWTSEALPHARDAIERLRFMAAMTPGSALESGLVSALRLQGRICSDLGRSEEAVQAFARAAEIVDRYPSADPAIAWGGNE